MSTPKIIKGVEGANIYTFVASIAADTKKLPVFPKIEKKKRKKNPPS
jgi:hypothetical protein